MRSLVSGRQGIATLQVVTLSNLISNLILQSMNLSKKSALFTCGPLTMPALQSAIQNKGFACIVKIVL